MERLGKDVVRQGRDVIISGQAHFASGNLDCGNSGTTARLLMGILAGREGEWILTGDESLSRRPMERVAIPLRKMGARIELTDRHLPARIVGTRLKSVEYDSEIASAQLKSAVLLAGLAAEGITRFREPVSTRDHTERLLGLSPDAAGWITLDPTRIHIDESGLSAFVPADISSAAFWIASAIAIPDSELTLPAVLMNPRRSAYIDVLRRASANIVIEDEHESGTEPAATLKVSGSKLAAFRIHGGLAAQCIDEIPVLAVLAALARGRSEFHDVQELRVKESDRFRLITENLRLMGAKIERNKDSFFIDGGTRLHGAEIETGKDHRIAMTFAAAGLAATGSTVINEPSCVSISYPGFWDDMKRIAPGSVLLEC